MHLLEPTCPSSRTRHRQRRIRHVFRTHQILYNLLALASITTGLWLSLSSGNWQWFSRSGSLLVVLGVMLTSHQIIENSRRLRHRRVQHASNFRHDYAEDYEHQKLEQASVNEEDIWHNGLRGLYLLIAGTLIWGFGDLPGLWFG